MFKKVLRYARTKAGIEANRKLLAYQAALTHMNLPELLPIDKELVQKVKDQINNNYGVKEFKTQIHKNDLMFSYHLYHLYGEVYPALFGHFAVGASFAKNLSELVDEKDIGVKDILDFGSGYGRVSRFIPCCFPDAELRVSEVKEEALKFQSEVLEFAPLHHTSDPESFKTLHYDLIMAVSVFTHLPKEMCEAWLKKLESHLHPGGAIVFTYNDLATAPSGIREKAEGDFHFVKNSEDILLSFIADANTNEDEYGHAYLGFDFIFRIASELNLEVEMLENKLTAKQKAVMLLKKESGTNP